MKNKVLDGLFGLCVGDALGVPVEFIPRERLFNNPVKKMISFGTHNQPVGTWSDDSSLALCLAESLCNGFDLRDMGDKFCDWFNNGYWTPYGTAFDIGRTTRKAIIRLFDRKKEPIECGGDASNDNGNGSLMRILPIIFYVIDKEQNEQFEITHHVSCLTHAHPISQIACGMFVQFALNLLKGDDLRNAYINMQKTSLEFYSTNKKYAYELDNFSRILKDDISKLEEDEIQSGGYVVHTLEASIWCLLNSSSYADSVLKAVNLGDDTDTTGAVTGGLAGLYYGFESIPKNWIEQIVRKQDIFDLSERLNKKSGLGNSDKD